MSKLHPRHPFGRYLAVLVVLLAPASAVMAESVAIVVAKECKLDELSLPELRAILHCEKLISPNHSKWNVTLRPKASLEHQALLKIVFKCTTEDLETYFKMGEFNGSIDPSPKIVASSALLQHILGGNQSAISYELASEVKEGVKTLRIEGTLPGDPNYPIKTD